MLKSLLRFEEAITRTEGRLLTIAVTVMLVLAVYNVFYRNALVPIQANILTPDEDVEAPAVVPEEPPEDSQAPEEEGDEDGFGGGFDDQTEGFGGGFDDSADETAGFGGGFGDEADGEDDAAGFGGGFDDASESAEDEMPSDTAPSDTAAGFGGDFDEAEEPADDGADEEAGGFAGGFDDGEDEAAGFGGGFGDAEEDDAAGFGGGFDDGEESADGFAGGFEGDSVAESDGAAAPALDDPSGQGGFGLEPDLTAFERFVVDAVDTLKIEWIDVFLRQLVLIVGFLGGMLATRRRKHITIDALTKVIPRASLPWVAAFTSLLSTVICIFLAVSGWDLVKISLEYPKELMSWAEEWTFQMAFPIGFGLLAFHFALRTMVSVGEIITGEDADALMGGEA